MSHISVLVKEWMGVLQDRSVLSYVDGTLGAGGHAEAVLRDHPEIETLIGIDQDQDALDIAKKRLLPWKEKLVLVHGNFEDLDTHLKKCNVSSVDAILLDLGVSSMQLDRSERGFSFMREGPLDMRMDTSQSLTAAEIVNLWSEQDLGRIFRDYGEEKRWRAAARAVVKAREERPISTTEDLVFILDPLLRTRSSKGIHPLTLVFQALRIAVNGELDVLQGVIPKAMDLLAPQGVLGIITFHSLEDRIVKRAFQFAASDKLNTSGLGSGLFIDKEPKVRILTRKPVKPSDKEMEKNPRSRSAKLRVVEKI